MASRRTAPKRKWRDIYCYFDNDMKVHAPYDAARLAALLDEPSALDAKGRFPQATPDAWRHREPSIARKETVDAAGG